MSSIELHNWQLQPWRQLQAAREQLPHSLLISGIPGLGKAAFASQLAASLLCQHPGNEGRACGQCKSCRLLAAGNHPDFLLTAPEEDSSIIGVDQVRAVISYFSLRPHTSARKLVILAPADAMNINASNSLLKILEEPPADSVLILVTSYPARLSATIRSRCTQVNLAPPPAREAISWLSAQGVDQATAADLLSAANGAPLLALDYQENGYQEARTSLFKDLLALQGGETDPVSCAERWKKIGTGFCLGWFNGLLADLIQLGAVGAASARLNNPSLASQLSRVAEKSDPRQLFGLLEKGIESANLASTPLDATLLIEDILIGWSKTRI